MQLNLVLDARISQIITFPATLARKRFVYCFHFFTPDKTLIALLYFCRLSKNTYSLWGYMWQNLPDYVNPFYKDGSHGVLRPSSSPQQLRWGFLLFYAARQQWQMRFAEMEYINIYIILSYYILLVAICFFYIYWYNFFVLSFILQSHLPVVWLKRWILGYIPYIMNQLSYVVHNKTFFYWQ